MSGTPARTPPAPAVAPSPAAGGDGPARRSVGLGLALAVASGALVALQQRFNGQLGTSLDDPLLAALVSFGAGLVVVAALVLSRASARRATGRLRQVPLAQRLGGLGGAALVTVGAIAAPQIGVALLTVGLVAGQTTGGVLVDRSGLGPGGHRPLTPARALGAGLCLVAVGISVAGKGAREADPLLLALVVLAGFLVSVQQALNGRVRATTGDASVATLVNFVVGTTALAVGVALHGVLTGTDVGTWPGPGQWYLYLGGPIGVVFVALAAILVRRLGVLRLALAGIAGQLAGALLLDIVAPLHSAGVDALTVCGVLLTLVAVAISGRSR